MKKFRVAGTDCRNSEIWSESLGMIMFHSHASANRVRITRIPIKTAIPYWMITVAQATPFTPCPGIGPQPYMNSGSSRRFTRKPAIIESRNERVSPWEFNIPLKA